MTFTVTVRSTNIVNVVTGPLISTVSRPDGQLTFTLSTTVGRTYRVFSTEDLGATAWSPMAPDFIAANPTASITDSGGAPQRFYKVLELQ